MHGVCVYAPSDGIAGCIEACVLAALILYESYRTE